MRINLAFAELSATLHSLEESLNVIEKQVESSQRSAKCKRDANMAAIPKLESDGGRTR